MTDDAMRALRALLEQDEELKARFDAAQTQDELALLMQEAGIAVPAGDQDLSDSDLEAVSGGYTFPATDWVYCDNPWTNYWCTLKCG